MLVKAVVHDQAVSHPNAVWLHGMSSDVGIITHIRIVEVGCGFRAIITDDRLVKRRKRGHLHTSKTVVWGVQLITVQAVVVVHQYCREEKNQMGVGRPAFRPAREISRDMYRGV